jgi:hypothetical protein
MEFPEFGTSMFIESCWFMGNTNEVIIKQVLYTNFRVSISPKDILTDKLFSSYMSEIIQLQRLFQT